MVSFEGESCVLQELWKQGCDIHGPKHDTQGTGDRLELGRIESPGLEGSVRQDIGREMERERSREDKVEGEVREVLLSLMLRNRRAAETDGRGAFDEMLKRRGHWHRIDGWMQSDSEPYASCE